MNRLSRKTFPLEEQITNLTKKGTYLHKSHDVNLFRLKFHLIYHIIEDVERFGNLEYLDASRYEHLKCVIRNFIRTTSMKIEHSSSEAVEAGNISINTEVRINARSWETVPSAWPYMWKL